MHGVARAQSFDNEGTVNDGDANAVFSDTTADGDNIDIFNTQYFESQPDQTNEFSDVDNENDDPEFDIFIDDTSLSDIDADQDNN